MPSVNKWDLVFTLLFVFIDSELVAVDRDGKLLSVRFGVLGQNVGDEILLFLVLTVFVDGC